MNFWVILALFLFVVVILPLLLALYGFAFITGALEAIEHKIDKLIQKPTTNDSKKEE